LGVSPGSVTEKEWPKFSIRIAQLKREIGTPLFKSHLQQLTEDIDKATKQVSDGKLARLLYNQQSNAGAGASPATSGTSYDAAVKLLNSNRTPEMEQFFKTKYGRLP